MQDIPSTSTPLKIIVASHNPVKLQATLSGFQRMFPEQAFEVEGVSVASGVADQPMTDEETLQGAANRAARAAKARPEAAYWVGLEGGVAPVGEQEMQSFAWMVVRGPGGRSGKARTGTFYLPPRVVELIHRGKELGEADDIVFNKSNSKQAGGAIGLLTHGVVDRAAYYSEAMVFALIPFKNQELY